MKLFLLNLILALILMLIILILSKKSFLDKEKTSAFECGFDPYLNSRSPFSLHFFKIALIFLIFDIEIALILPLPINSMFLNNFNLFNLNMIMFLIIMGLYFEWYQGSLNWN